MLDRLGNDDDQSTADNDVVRCEGYAAVVAAGFSEAVPLIDAMILIGVITWPRC